MGVVAGAAAGAVICLFMVKKKKKKAGYVQSTFSTTPTPVMPANGGEEINNDSKEGDTPAPSAAQETKETTEAEKTPEENDNV